MIGLDSSVAQHEMLKGCCAAQRRRTLHTKQEDRSFESTDCCECESDTSV